MAIEGDPPRVEVAGWQTERARPVRDQVTAVDALVDILRAVGVRQAFGIVGGGIAPFAEAVQRSPIELWHTRHEAGASFCATEAHFSTGDPTAVFVTTGPGLTNTLTGINAARWDGAKLVLVSGGTAASHRGRWGVQETTSYTTALDIFSPGRLFHYAVALTDLAELPEIARRLAAGFARPEGFVAHLNLPLNLQTAPMRRPRAAVHRVAPAGGEPAAITDCVRRLEQHPTPIWVGHGARHAAAEVRALVERSGAAVMCSPRAKGIIPENHAQFIGVTGVGGHEEVERYLAAHPPEHILVLGSRLGEASSCWSPAMVPRGGFLHVDLDPEVFGAAYPEAATIGIQAEIGAFTRAVLRELRTAGPTHPRTAGTLRVVPAPLSARAGAAVRPQYLMQVVQDVVIDATDAVVMTESGNSFGWGNHLLRFPAPARYRTSAAYGAMGHFVTGVVGAALARAGKAIALVGDGAMLMNNEISTAVQYGADAVWVVLNDGLYGITHQAMTAQGFAPVETALPPTDFAQFARSMGAAGSRVECEAGLAAAIALAMQHRGPIVVDVRIDPAQVNPVLKRRIESLKQQGAIAPEVRTS